MCCMSVYYIGKFLAITIKPSPRNAHRLVRNMDLRAQPGLKNIAIYLMQAGYAEAWK